MKTKKRPTVGDEAWVVEWVSKLAFYEDSEDVDRDNCTESRRSFRTREEALAFAVKTWPSTTDKFGIVTFNQVRFVPYDEADAALVPHAGYWEDVSDAEVISDDSGIPE